MQYEIYSLQLAGAATLHDESEFEAVCELITSHGRHNPMLGDVGRSIPIGKKLEFFQVAASVGKKLDDVMNASLFLALAFSHHIEHGMTPSKWKSATPPSPTPDKAALEPPPTS